MRNFVNLANLETFFTVSSEEYEPEPEENKNFQEKNAEKPKKYATRANKNWENKEKPAKERVNFNKFIQNSHKSIL